MRNIIIARDKVDPMTYVGRPESADRKCYIGLVNDAINAADSTSYEWRSNPAFRFNGPLAADAVWIVSVSHACYKRDEEAARKLFAERGIDVEFVETIAAVEEADPMQVEFNEVVTLAAIESFPA